LYPAQIRECTLWVLFAMFLCGLFAEPWDGYGGGALLYWHHSSEPQSRTRVIPVWDYRPSGENFMPIASVCSSRQHIPENKDKPAERVPAPSVSKPEYTHPAYRPEIDGLRAIAVLLVIAYHAEFGFLSGGFIGVDVFFVISGFLITTILLTDLDNGRFSLKTFYERRCRRILPPLAAVCLATLAAGWLILMPVDFRSFGSSLVAAATFWANHYFFQHAGYFDTASFTKPLLHTWSLAVEEQFYVVLPLLLWMIHTRFRKWLPYALVCICAVSLTCSQTFLTYTPWGKETESAYYLLPSRFWEMLAGSLLVLPTRFHMFRAPRTNRGGGLYAVFCWTGIGLILTAAALYDHKTPFPGMAALAPCLGAVLFIFAAGRVNKSHWPLPVRALSHPWMTGIGKISYSLYLWHWPLLVLPRYHADTPLSSATKIWLIAVSFGMAWLSWRYVENPVRRRAMLKSRRAVFAASAACIILLATLGTVLRRADGFPERLPERARPFSHSIRDRYNHPPWKTYAHIAARNGVRYRFQAWDVNPGHPPSFMFLGNSHARMWLEAVDILAMEHDVSGIVIDPSSYRGDLLSLEKTASNGWNTDDYLLTMMDMAYQKGVQHVLLAIRTSPSTGLPVLAETALPANDWSRNFAERLQKTTEAYSERGMTLWFAENVPEYMTDMPNTLTRHAMRGGEASDLGYSVEYYRNRNSPLTALFPALEAEGLKILRMEPAFFVNGRCSPGDAGGSYYLDTNHLTRYGARLHKGALAPFFEAAQQGNF
jgi:peptidoglycan/LPS O-acetylase OafA/YrhL